MSLKLALSPQGKDVGVGEGPLIQIKKNPSHGCDEIPTLTGVNPVPITQPELANETKHDHTYAQRDGSKLALASTRWRQVTDLSQALTHLHTYTDILSSSKEIAA